MKKILTLFMAFVAITSQAYSSAQQMVPWDELREIVDGNAKFKPAMPSTEQVDDFMDSSDYAPDGRAPAMSSQLILASHLGYVLNDELTRQKSVFSALGFVEDNPEASKFSALTYDQVNTHLAGLQEIVTRHGYFWKRAEDGEDIVADAKEVLNEGEASASAAHAMCEQEESMQAGNNHEELAE